MLKACPLCGDTKIESMLSSVSCTTHDCKNFHLGWEKRALDSYRDHIVLCFCQDCIHCNGEQEFIGKFRSKNVVYDVYHSHYDNGDGIAQYIIMIYSDSIVDSIQCELQYIDMYRNLVKRDYPELLLGYDIFHDELWSKKLAEIED